MNSNQRLTVVSSGIAARRLVTRWCRANSRRHAGALVLASSLLAGALVVAVAPAAHAADGPTVIKPSVFVGVTQSWHYWQPATKKFQPDTTTWVPRLKFAVYGPVPGGSQFVVDFTKPGDRPWLSLDCPTQEIKADERAKVETKEDNSTEAEKLYTIGTGVFGFKIRVKNELTNQNQVLFSGHFKVGKVSKYNGTPVTKNQNDYYVDYDWVLPFAYVWFDEDEVSSSLAVSMWFKNPVLGDDLAGYVFYKGKQIASTKEGGSTGTAEEELRTVHGDKGDPGWQLRQIEWSTVSRTAHDPANPIDKLHYLDKNPGEYEIKILRSGKLSRDMKFTVGDDGKIVDNGLGAPDKLNTKRMVFPVQIIGTQDGTYQKSAWKTEAFYGNPVLGFAAVE